MNGHELGAPVVGPEVLKKGKGDRLTTKLGKSGRLDETHKNLAVR